MSANHNKIKTKKLLDDYNILQTEIAKRAQASPSAVSQIISGHSKSRRIMKVIWEMLKERSADEAEIAFLLTRDKGKSAGRPASKVLLKKAGLTQTYIAQKARVSCTAVSFVVNGKFTSTHIENIIREELARASAKQD